MTSDRAMVERPHLVALDGLRGVAAIVVVCLHATFPFYDFGLVPHGALAVDFFFCLSGFVIALAYRDKLLSSMSVRQFIIVRLVRLYPMIFIGSLLGLCVFLLRASTNHDLIANPYLVLLIATASFLIIPSAVGLSSDWPPIFPLNAPMWSLVFELAANLIYAKYCNFFKGRRLLVLVVISGFTYALYGFVQGSVGRVLGQDLWFDGAIRVVYPFLAGVFVYQVSSDKSKRFPSYSMHFIVLLLLFVFFLPVPNMLLSYFEIFSVIIIFPMVVYYAARIELSSPLIPVCAFLGRISYPVYLIHAPLLRVGSYFLRSMHLSTSKLLALLAIEVLVCVVLAFFVAKFIDEPVRAWLRNAANKPRVPRSNFA